ncbi:TetR/AcrR family transcriptional regulator [Pseudoblastomonas halimionae]|uniref:TetR family transcriptional regulator n=1 Tax=Alteriqipengyuania halimionae TaxID=1926630 RepID=A0A6I4U147_9SPHN|nr:TetR/AcrR family transcriptional regulator [Alteriqipengyuania halimionae]MXP08984.1 TetR family transcriptional regulator [Alteriqipengyuania halimionae]
MDERARQIAAAGYAVINRYGLKRASMADIAEEAGVSRQTVYNVFPNREALLVGVVTYHFDSRWEALWAAAKPDDDRRHRFEALLEHLLIQPWKQMQAMPNSEELEIEVKSALETHLAGVQAETQRRLCEFLLPYEDILQARGTSSQGLGQMLHHSLIGLKMCSSCPNDLESTTSTMLACLMALTEDAG